MISFYSSISMSIYILPLYSIFVPLACGFVPICRSFIEQSINHKAPNIRYKVCRPWNTFVSLELYVYIHIYVHTYWSISYMLLRWNSAMSTTTYINEFHCTLVCYAQPSKHHRLDFQLFPNVSSSWMDIISCCD